MKRTLGENRTFKGSVFVEFETKEEAQAFVATKDLKYKDNELTYMTKDDYFNSKKVKGKKGLDKSSSDQDKPTDKEEMQDDNYPKGRVIHFSGAGGQTSREDLKEIFNVEGLMVKWVDFNKGDKEGFVRFMNDGDAEKAMKAVLEKHDNKLTLRDEETTLRVIEGDEEKNYWKKTKEDMVKLQKSRRGGKKPYHRGNMKRGRNDSKTNDEPAVKQAKSDT